MADGKEAKEIRWKKSEKHRRMRRQELWAKEEKEIKELEDRCRDVSCRLSSLIGASRRVDTSQFVWRDFKTLPRASGVCRQVNAKVTIYRYKVKESCKA